MTVSPTARKTAGVTQSGGANASGGAGVVLHASGAKLPSPLHRQTVGRAALPTTLAAQTCGNPVPAEVTAAKTKLLTQQ